MKWSWCCLCQKLSDVIYWMILNCEGLLVSRPQRLSSGWGCDHWQVKVMPLIVKFKSLCPQETDLWWSVQVVCFTLSLCVCSSLWFCCSGLSHCLLGKSSIWKQMPWSFTAFSILACLLWHFYCILRKQALVFPFLLKPKHHLLSLVSNIHDVAGLCLPLSCNPCQPLFVNLWRKAKYPDLNKNNLHLHFDTVFGSICVFFLLYIIFYSIFHLFNIFCISSSHLLECFASYLQDLELNRILPRERFEQICPIMDSKWMSGSVFFPVKKVTWEWQVCFKGSTLTFSG